MSHVPRHPRSFCLAALGAFVALAAGPASALADQQPGSISGTVSGALPPSSKGVVVVRAINALTGAVADTDAVGRDRKFRVIVDPGLYALKLTVAQPGRAASEKTIQVSVGDGQSRRNLRFAIGAAKASRAAASPASAPASRAYVSADGTEVAGVTAYSVEPFSGGTGDWKDVRSSLAAAMQAEAQDETTCSGQAIANAPERRAVQRLSFKASATVAKGTKVDRNLIVGDVAIGGKIKAAKGGKSARVTVTFVDKRTGKTYDTVKATLRTSKFASNERALAKVIGERLCRRPVSYKVVLGLDGRADFSGHSATGRMDATLSATPTGGTGGQGAITYSGKGPIGWTKLVFTSKKGCTFTNPRPATGQWAATVTSGADGQLTVDWGPSGPLYFAASTATVNCPGVNPQSGQGGPSLVGLLPNATKLSPSGGTLAVGGNLSVLDASFSSNGTLKITPVWRHLVP